MRPPRVSFHGWQPEAVQEIDTVIIAQRQPEHPPASVHVVPHDLADERALALLDRYVEAIEVGEHPPYWYVGKVFSELYVLGMARRAKSGREP
jgi:hypothetical protein